MARNRLKRIIRDVPDFPKPGIIFKDITPILQDPKAFRAVINAFTRAFKGKEINAIAGIESRGFIFGPVLAHRLKVPFLAVRKKGKLPWKTKQASYALEYGEAAIEIHEDACSPGTRVAIIDDLLATGGTAEAAARLIETLGAQVVMMAFVIELGSLKGREKLSRYDVFSLVQY